jgi:hypothetical protein
MTALVTSPPAKQKGSKRKHDKEEPVDQILVPNLENDGVLPSPEAAAVEAEVEEVEVLSHAAQRKAKKRKLKDPHSTEDAEDNALEPPKLTPKSSSHTKPAAHIRQNSVWVGNLSFKTTEAQLKEFFDGVGEITRVHMPKKLDGGHGRGMRGDNRG